MSRYVYRKMERRDHEALSVLHENHLGCAPRDNDFFEWKYWRSPGGPHESVVAEETDTGRIVGELGGIAVMMRYFGTTGPVYFDVDVVIDRDAARGRIFFPIYRKRLEFIAERKVPSVPLNCSFTIPKTLKIMSKTWKIRGVAPAPKLAKVLKHGAYISRKTGSKLIAGAGGLLLDLWSSVRYPMIAPRQIDVTEVDAFDAGADALWERMKDYYNIWVVRDRKFLNWRYVDIPHVENTILVAREKDALLGYLVINFQDDNKRAGVIQDFQFLKERKDAGRALLRKGIDFLKGVGSEVAIIWDFDHTHTHAILAEFGFGTRETTGRHFCVREAIELEESVIQIPFERARERTSWFLGKGDADDD